MIFKCYMDINVDGVPNIAEKTPWSIQVGFDYEAD